MTAEDVGVVFLEEVLVLQVDSDEALFCFCVVFCQRGLRVYGETGCVVVKDVVGEGDALLVAGSLTADGCAVVVE